MSVDWSFDAAAAPSPLWLWAEIIEEIDGIRTPGLDNMLEAILNDDAPLYWAEPALLSNPRPTPDLHGKPIGTAVAHDRRAGDCRRGPTYLRLKWPFLLLLESLHPQQLPPQVVRAWRASHGGAQ
jgi:hypothetical protein